MRNRAVECVPAGREWMYIIYPQHYPTATSSSDGLQSSSGPYAGAITGAGGFTVARGVTASDAGATTTAAAARGVTASDAGATTTAAAAAAGATTTAAAAATTAAGRRLLGGADDLLRPNLGAYQPRVNNVIRCARCLSVRDMSTGRYRRWLPWVCTWAMACRMGMYAGDLIFVAAFVLTVFLASIVRGRIRARYLIQVRCALS